jgi:hypothetical protein
VTQEKEKKKKKRWIMDNDPKRTRGDVLVVVVGEDEVVAPSLMRPVVRRVCKFFLAISAFITQLRSMSTLRPDKHITSLQSVFSST